MNDPRLIRDRGLSGAWWPMLLAAVLAAFPLLAVSQSQIRILALFPGRALVAVDGDQAVLRTGQPGPGGIVLESADSRQAVIRVDGVARTFYLDQRIDQSYRSPDRRVARIPRNSSGAYVSSGTVNGQPVEFLVDTGATTVAMSSVTAKRLGIMYRVDGQKGQVTTASGTATAHSVVLGRVKVGEIELRDVQAVVINGSKPQQVLLGMTFLGRLDMQNKGQLLELRARF